MHDFFEDDMDRNDEIALNDRKSLRMVRRVTWLGFGVNAALGVLKVAGAFLAWPIRDIRHDAARAGAWHRRCDVFHRGW